MTGRLVDITAAQLAATAPQVLDEHTDRFLQFLALASRHKGEMTIDRVMINSLAISSAPERLLFVRRVLSVADVIKE